MVVPVLEPLDVSGLTANSVIQVSTDMARMAWNVHEWRQWTHGGPHFHWLFGTTVTLFIIEGVALGTAKWKVGPLPVPSFATWRSRCHAGWF